MWIVVDIQIPAWVNHDGRSFGWHYELLSLAKDINSESIFIKEMRGKAISKSNASYLVLTVTMPMPGGREREIRK